MLSFDNGGENCFKCDLYSIKSSCSLLSSNTCISFSSSTLSCDDNEKFIKLLLLHVASAFKFKLCIGNDDNISEFKPIVFEVGIIIEEDRLLIVKTAFDTVNGVADDNDNNDDVEENESQTFAALFVVKDSEFSESL